MAAPRPGIDTDRVAWCPCSRQEHIREGARMGLEDWLRVFRTLHEQAKKGELSGTDAEDYRSGCDELSRALIAAQKLTLRPGEVPRRVLRVPRAVQVTLETKLVSVRTMTIDVSVAGFSALLGKA